MVEVELVRGTGSDGSLSRVVLLAELPYKLVTEEPLHSVSKRKFPHCHAISEPLLPPASMPTRCLGKGRGGGIGSLTFAMGIGTEGEDGEGRVLFSVDTLEDRNRLDRVAVQI